MENKFLNFDGMPSDVPNDMPWSDTTWSNQAGGITEEDVERVSTLYGTALNASGKSLCGGEAPPIPNRNASGQESITLDHHTELSPNMVLTDDANSSMPDSDVWSNHPGFLGWTWSASKREDERYQKELSKVNSDYQNTGSCAVLTDSLGRLDKSLASLNANSGSGSRGAKRVRKRAIKARKARRGSVNSGMTSACAGEEASFQRDVSTQQQMVLQSGAAAGAPSAISPINLMLGFLVIGGIGFGIYKMSKR